MHTTRLLLLATLCSTLAGGLVGCDDSPPSSNADAGVIGPVLDGCTVTTDPVTADMSQPDVEFLVNRLQLPSGASLTVVDGVDVDGLATTSTTSADGCFMRDTKATATSTANDVDNQLAAVGSAASALGVDISGSLQSAVEGASPSLVLRVVLQHWNHTLTDGCVTVQLYAGSGGATPTLNGETVTAMRGGVTSVLGGWTPVGVNIRVHTVPNCTVDAAVSCAGGETQDCDATIPLVVYGMKLRLHVASKSTGGFQLVTDRPNPPESITGVSDPTLLAGFVYWGSKTGAIEAGSFQEAMKNAMCELGQNSQWTTVQGIIGGKLDLRSSSTGDTPTACTGTNASSSNANSLSLGAYMGSGY